MGVISKADITLGLLGYKLKDYGGHKFGGHNYVYEVISYKIMGVISKADITLGLLGYKLKDYGVHK